MKTKYGEKAKLCQIDTNSFIVYLRIKKIYVDIGRDIETRFDTSNQELERPSLPRQKNKNVIELMKDELGGKIITNSVTLRLKGHSYLTKDNDENRKAKFRKLCHKTIT